MQFQLSNLRSLAIETLMADYGRCLSLILLLLLSEIMTGNCEQSHGRAVYHADSMNMQRVCNADDEYRQDIKITFHRSFSGLRVQEQDKQRRLNEIHTATFPSVTEIGFESRRYPLYRGCNTRRVLQRHIRRYVS